MSEQKRYTKLYESLHDGKDLLYASKILERSAQLFPHNVAVIINQQQKITYQQLYIHACAISHYLMTQGIKPHDRIMILYENGINFYITYFGAWQTGAVVVPMNTFLHEKEVEHIINDAEPAMIIVSKKLRSKIPPATKQPIITEEIIEQIIQQQSTKPFPIHQLEPDEMCALLYTSGTTGLPKGVMLSSRNIMTNIIQGAARFTISTQERVYCALPLFHSLTQNTCVWASTIFGATVILVPHISRTHLLAGLDLKPTMVLGVPGLYALLCRMKTAQFDHARYIISGGDALVDKIRLYFELLYGRKICNGYGLSETSPFVSVDLDDIVAPTNTVGKPFIGIEYQIRDGNPIGTLWLKGPNIMLGYYRAPEATQKVLQDGWFNTGDLAMIDRHGKIIICGREKELIANKGIKIYPQEVENILMSHPNVTMAAVIGMRNETEEFPVAYITLKDQNEHATEQLQAFCKQHLAPYKIPRQFFIVDTLPLTATGKVDKKELKKLHTS